METRLSPGGTCLYLIGHGELVGLFSSRAVPPAPLPGDCKPDFKAPSAPLSPQNQTAGPDAHYGQPQQTTVQGGKATVNFAGIPGYQYIVQRAENVDFTVNLSPRLTTNVPANGLFIFEEETALSKAYYRLKYNPQP